MKANFKANPIQIVSIESNLANLVDVIFFTHLVRNTNKKKCDFLVVGRDGVPL